MFCVTCGGPRPANRKYCSDRCMYARPNKRREPYQLRRERAERTAPRRLCETCGQPFAFVRKLRERFCSNSCSSTFTAWKKAGASVEWRCEVPWKTCDYCETRFISRQPQARYCSKRCGPKYRPEPAQTKVCRVCLATFTRQGHGARSSTCSKKCRSRWEATRPKEIARRRKKREEREAFIASGERFANWEIYVRDNWTCHICGKHIPRKKWPHPLSPTIDHLVPVNGHEGGEHTRRNVRAAHFICNAKRREVGPAQLILFGEIAA